LLRDLDIADIVTLAPEVGYRDALREMIDAGALLIFQGPSCNHQIPAKLYEYMRSGRPIVALTDGAGDTARSLRDVGCDNIADIGSAAEIKTTLLRVLEQLRAGSAAGVPRAQAEMYSRKAGAETLAAVLDEVSAERAARSRH
jgi:hypothetical protein